MVTPNAGRAYNASGIGGVCGQVLQGGWAAANTGWGSSSWDATALQSTTFAGQLVQLELRYGIDAGGNDFGFHFDEVTVTNVDVEVPDNQTNSCAALPPFFADGFETGNTSGWSSTVPDPGRQGRRKPRAARPGAFSLARRLQERGGGIGPDRSDWTDRSNSEPGARS